MKNILIILTAFLFVSCSSSNGKFDAQGVFESDEVMVASEVPGKLLSFEVNEGDIFDPSIHEAVSQAEANKEKQEDGVQAVAKVLQRGYKLGEKIVRPAKVSVM